jgi:hypothetical protein
VWRAIFLLLTVLMVGNATGLIPDADEIACSDDEGKECPPSCPTCTCASHQAKTAAIVQIELVQVELTWSVELPPLRAVHGRLAPLFVNRPPIA